MIQNQKLQMVAILPKKALDKTEACHKNFDIDANDQTKQGPEPERLVQKTNMNHN
jgi:hypothetical protein